MKWQLNKIHYPVYNLGEGKRIGIWVQGCSLGCKKCLNKSTWDRKKGKSVSVPDVFNWLVSLDEKYDGITISGGEPFQQYPQLIAFCHLVKSRTSLSIQCFSGYYLDELEELFPDRIFLKYIDVLIDGRYIENMNENFESRGSSNQTIYSIKDGVPLKNNEISVNNKWSVKISSDNQIYMTGIPKKNFLNELCDELSNAGIIKKFS